MNHMEEFKLRFADEKDTPAIIGLIKELAVYEKMLDRVIATEEMLKETVFEKKCAKVILAEYTGRPIGYAMYFYNYSSFIGRPGLYLEDIFVKPEYRGKGFGKTILKFLAETALKEGCFGMEWTCLNWNQPSIRFYESLGANHQDEWRIYRLNGDALKNLASDGGR